jgi:hypothetical protein
MALLFSGISAEPAIKNCRRDIPAAAMVRDLDEGRLDQKANRFGIVSGFSQPGGANIPGKQDALVAE